MRVINVTNKFEERELVFGYWVRTDTNLLRTLSETINKMGLWCVVRKKLLVFSFIHSFVVVLFLNKHNANKTK